jgi:hypothetical protein
VQKGTTRGQRQALCRACQSRVALTYGTPSVDVEHDPARLAVAMRAWAEGHAMRAPARSVHVEQETIGLWLDRAAQHGRRVRRHVWPPRPGRACPLDERWRVVQTTDAPRAWAQLARETDGEAWVWVALAPEWRVVRALVVGTRTPGEAPLLRERVAPVTTALIPCLTSAQWPADRPAWRPVSGAWQPPPRRVPRQALR